MRQSFLSHIVSNVSLFFSFGLVYVEFAHLRIVSLWNHFVFHGMCLSSEYLYYPTHDTFKPLGLESIICSPLWPRLESIRIMIFICLGVSRKYNCSCFQQQSEIIISKAKNDTSLFSCFIICFHMLNLGHDARRAGTFRTWNWMIHPISSNNTWKKLFQKYTFTWWKRINNWFLDFQALAC